MKNLSGSPDEDYFAEGLTEELITELSKLIDLRVISRTSAMHYKGSQKTLPEIARELKVEAVVEGAAMRSGEQVRITAQLIEVATDTHIWAESYRRELRDILGLQRDIAHAIARQIQSNLAPRRKVVPGVPRVNPAAYLAYQKGRYWWNQRSEASLQKGIELFQEAIDHDPLYPAAYSGLADCLTALGYASSLAPKETFPKAKAMALRVLELDASDAEPHASLGYAKLYYDWDWKGAESEFREAIALNRNYVTAHHWYSVYLTAMGRQQSAEIPPDVRKAIEMIPNTRWLMHCWASTIICLGQMCIPADLSADRAQNIQQKAIAIDDWLSIAHSVLAAAYMQEREDARAADEAERGIMLNPNSAFG